MRSIVLGCGPAGLMAAHAITLQTGTRPFIYSKGARKSEMYGAQYLHKPIPGLKNGAGTEGTLITYETWGSVEDYKAKVYGETWSGSVSPEDLPGEHMAWDIRAAYNELWLMYSDAIFDVDIRKDRNKFMGWALANYDMVVSSVPKPLLCREGHTFSAQTVKAIGDAPERGVRSPVRAEMNRVVCNGEPEPSWYRAANVFGYCTVEYPESVEPPYPGLATVDKPLMNNCNCYPDVIHVGRYGRWEKGVLSHHAFKAAYVAAGER